jgi:16S rRNA G1207 methylase RsmC
MFWEKKSEGWKKNVANKMPQNKNMAFYNHNAVFSINQNRVMQTFHFSSLIYKKMKGLQKYFLSNPPIFFPEH